MHSHCFGQYTRYNYTCPLCSKSLGDMAVYFQVGNVSDCLCNWSIGLVFSRAFTPALGHYALSNMACV